ncbi:MAG: maleylpyruvate isomerase N-terminal domain-containing protein [Candidatus Dormibacteraeota bacterium]|uniref:Maleylpyruvate isomerase N-terminal domain-containing protein n=1 Tax=Candidatus Amunia macphersoniae TaxID=3127014 RepID=A0A934NIK0_9BACT|nr:maleylpyruvate isomerase N-terminal domain-containing protein [Candidatus Dormibacteraeota bacterium]
MDDTASHVPSMAIAGMVKAHAALARTIADLNDEVARRPSLLPGWSVGHVLTHIARNADSVTRRLQGAAEDRIVDQYAGGAEGRQHDIEEGAGRAAAELIADVLRTNHQVEAAVSTFPALAWDRLTRCGRRGTPGAHGGVVTMARGRGAPRRPWDGLPAAGLARRPRRLLATRGQGALSPHR